MPKILHTKGKYIPPLLFFLISLIITLVWFNQGLMYGGAEVGLLTYDPQRSLEIQKFIWWGSSAPGMLVPHFITGVPFYFVLSLLQKILSPVNLQAMIFLTLFFLMGYGMFKFCLSVLGEQKKSYAVLAGLFYMFNSYTMVEVLHRFLYTAFFLAAFLPFIVLSWRNWINEGKFIFLALFLLINLTCSYMFGNLASVLTVWLGLLLMTISDVAFPIKNKKELIKVGFRFFLGAFFWFITNLWWLIPFFTVSTGLLTEQHTSEGNINTLVNIGRQTILPFTLQFANPFYLFYTIELGRVYTTLFFKLISWVPIFVIFMGIVISLKRKFLAGFALIYLLVIIFSKGPATPFGYPYIWAFKNIYALGVIRNPFEKLGILLPFFGSILFVIGFEAVLFWVKKRFGKVNSIFLGTAILMSISIFAHPIFFGTVLKKPVEPVLIHVPQNYKQADEWFKLQSDKKGNILHLPFSGGDVVTYNWENGYHGVDINEILFTHSPSITRNLGLKTVDETLSSLTYSFNQPFLENKDQLLKILQNLNVNYILLHKDVRWTDIATYGKDIKLLDPANLERSLDNLDFLEKKAVFGDLSIYKLKDNFYKQKIILSRSAELVYPGENNFLKITALLDSKNEIVTTSLDNFSEETLQKVKNIWIFPSNYLDYSIASSSAFNSMANDMLINPEGPDSLIDKLNKIENYFSQSGELNSHELIQEIIESTESLIKIYSDKSLSEEKLSILEDYQNLLKQIFENNFKSLSLLKLFKAQTENTFYLHIHILEQLEKNESIPGNKVLEIRKYLIEGLKENNLLPLKLSTYETQAEEINRKILQYKIPLKSKYEIIMVSPNNHNLYPNLLSNLNIRINDRSINRLGKLDKNIISFGEFDFDKDTYEISYDSLLSSNLVPILNNFLKAGNVEFVDKDTAHLNSANQGIAYLENPITNVIGKDVYKITFDALSEKGSEFYVEIMQETEDFDSQKEYQKIQSDECSKHNCYPVKLDAGAKAERKYTIITAPLNLASRKASIRILVFTKVENGQQIPGEIFIKNFQVNSVFDGDLILKKNISDIGNSFFQGEVINMIRLSPVSYFGKIKVGEPSFLFFKETFDKGWTLILTKGNEKYKINDHYIGNLYANSYFIDRVGEYDFKLEFEPQKGADKGIILSIIGWITIFSVLMWSEFRRRE